MLAPELMSICVYQVGTASHMVVASKGSRISRIPEGLGTDQWHGQV